jgi:hypothetical protein
MLHMAIAILVTFAMVGSGHSEEGAVSIEIGNWFNGGICNVI